jgi:hypothetical protein
MSKPLKPTNTDSAFWTERWNENQIAFHKYEINS